MSLTINAICHGFKVLEASFVEEVHSKAYILEHLHSGARLLYLANDDDNKVFSIAFGNMLHFVHQNGVNTQSKACFFHHYPSNYSLIIL